MLFFFFLLVVVELPDEPDGKRFELFFEREGQVEASTQTTRPITVNVKPLLKEHLLDLFKKNTYHKTVCRTCAESFSFLFWRMKQGINSWSPSRDFHFTNSFFFWYSQNYSNWIKRISVKLWCCICGGYLRVIWLYQSWCLKCNPFIREKRDIAICVLFIYRNRASAIDGKHGNCGNWE